jgi:hypothetical protein
MSIGAGIPVRGGNGGTPGKNLRTGVVIDALHRLAPANAIVTRIDPTASQHPFPQLERA